LWLRQLNCYFGACKSASSGALWCMKHHLPFSVRGILTLLDLTVVAKPLSFNECQLFFHLLLTARALTLVPLWNSDSIPSFTSTPWFLGFSEGKPCFLLHGDESDRHNSIATRHQASHQFSETIALYLTDWIARFGSYLRWRSRPRIILTSCDYNGFMSLPLKLANDFPIYTLSIWSVISAYNTSNTRFTHGRLCKAVFYGGRNNDFGVNGLRLKGRIDSSRLFLFLTLHISHYIIRPLSLQT
jgi:hypothetical protein